MNPATRPIRVFLMAFSRADPGTQRRGVSCHPKQLGAFDLRVRLAGDEVASLGGGMGRSGRSHLVSPNQPQRVNRTLPLVQSVRHSTRLSETFQRMFNALNGEASFVCDKILDPPLFHTTLSIAHVWTKDALNLQRRLCVERSRRCGNATLTLVTYLLRDAGQTSNCLSPF